MALGAQTGNVMRMVLGRGMALAVAGAIIGLGASFALPRLMSDLLFGVQATDPPTLVAITLLLLAVALVSCFIPARRATKVDPLVALRDE
jgi:putative ABC transport system permease protein